MHLRLKNTLVNYGRILAILFLFSSVTLAACGTETETNSPNNGSSLATNETAPTNTSEPLLTATNTPTPTPTPTATATATATVEPVLDGEQILQNAIRAINEREAYVMEFSSAGGLGNSTSRCTITNAPAFLCQHNPLTNADNRNQSQFLQINNNAWYKDYPDQSDWTFVPTGFKTGYSGINDFALVQQITNARQVIVDGKPIFQIEYEVEPELLLQLFLQDASQAPEFIAQAETVLIRGRSFIDPKTYLPLRESLTIAIESDTKPLSATNEIVYDFTSPAQIELPQGEILLQIGHEFFAAINDARIDDAYAYFAAEAQAVITLEALEAFTDTYRDLFAGYESLQLERYDNAPEISDTDITGEFALLMVEAIYSEREPQPFNLIYLKGEEGWKLVRFDAIVPKEPSS